MRARHITKAKMFDGALSLKKYMPGFGRAFLLQKIVEDGVSRILSQLQREGMVVFNGAGLSSRLQVSITNDRPLKTNHAFERPRYCLLPTCCVKVPQHMADETALLDADVAVVLSADDGVAEPRIYEIGYHIIPTVKEEDVEKTVGEIRSAIEKSAEKVNFIAEGAPSLIRLAYPMSVREGEKYTEYDRGYFGWIKFEAAASIVSALNNALKSNPSVLRFVIWKTVREDTRAKIKPPTLREIKRTDIIKSTPRRAPAEEVAAPVSEEDLEKAIQDITAE